MCFPDGLPNPDLGSGGGVGHKNKKLLDEPQIPVRRTEVLKVVPPEFIESEPVVL